MNTKSGVGVNCNRNSFYIIEYGSVKLLRNRKGDRQTIVLFLL